MNEEKPISEKPGDEKPSLNGADSSGTGASAPVPIGAGPIGPQPTKLEPVADSTPEPAKLRIYIGAAPGVGKVAREKPLRPSFCTLTALPESKR